jgi:FixJ family two-component response regulator
VYVVDDDEFIRTAIESLLRSAGMEVYCFASPSEFLARPTRDAPACLILDVHLPGRNGLEIQRELASLDPLPIVFISGHGDIPTSVRAMKAGAVEFLPKPFQSEELLGAVELALLKARGEWCYRQELSELLSRVALLTPREREVLSHVVCGLLNKQIASALGISEATVKGHRSQLMRKLRANSIADLVRMAGRVGVGPDWAAPRDVQAR